MRLVPFVRTYLGTFIRTPTPFKVDGFHLRMLDRERVADDARGDATAADDLDRSAL
ncbi:hypothetical protein [Plantactinospora sp. BB1]|uniref:hypothetical protein n=1 Tax=Plantactinospora sp. BB1 TaxID=2071627 RepID=UPI00131F2D94|nr:hypothetical protein [Plantactinospora sp. BB1]